MTARATAPWKDEVATLVANQLTVPGEAELRPYRRNDNRISRCVEDSPRGEDTEQCPNELGSGKSLSPMKLAVKLTKLNFT